MRKGSERRQATRISHICEVECEASGLNPITTRLNDLSVTGAFIDSMSCFSRGTILKLRFRIKDVLIETSAEVRYSMQRVGMGVRFLDLQPNQVAALESLIDDKPLVIPQLAPARQTDRREDKRISYVCEVECHGAGLGRLVTRINDLSTSGAFIDSTTCYAPGTVVDLRFRLNELTIETSAEVRYGTRSKGMGVRFRNLRPEHRAALASLIEGKPLESPPRAEPNKANENNTSDAPNMLLGNFAVVSMFDVIQLIENNRLSGSLEVTSRAASGAIQFNEGQIVGAQSGSNESIEALKAFLDVTEGTFGFHRSADTYPRTIDAPNNMSLMLDLLRVKDEEAAARQ
ncbi:MAG TPA: PilZ domain-containing protein [Blastocatellia bacterium]|nr:PilZ domain-containing protein [Blastocatellia bacterium]